VVLLIGDFTATIGDPTDKTSARVKLSRQQVLQNAHDYQQQASKILDFTCKDNPAELRYNSEWLGKMGFADVLELASEFTVQQMLERDMFKRRMANNKPVGLHEFLYPIMQGWDSVCLDVDIEVGGSDQIFNMLVGSTLVKRHKNRQKFVIAGDLLVDPSGKKIGKTEGNMITLNDEPLDMFHKIMMWGDGITPHALELCSRLPMERVNQIAQQLKDGQLSGLDGKLFLAKTIVTELHSAQAAAKALQDYQSLTDKDKQLDKQSFAKATVKSGQSIIDVLVESGLAESRSSARRLVVGHGVRINDQTVDETWTVGTDNQGAVLQVGKKKHQNHRLLVVER
jgi:tyrosyl-tRNA synthetase